jgi:isopentenyl-diphosphate Delta-isomerase
MERVILVDENDTPLGTMEKMEAHEKGVLHRAFSVFIFNQKGEMLLQQRAFTKYHSSGLWTNTCCSHPRENELTIDAAHRRLQEEMGFDCEIEKAFDFIYKRELDQGLTEHELDHVFIGEFEGEVCFNKEEVNAYIYIPVQDVLEEVNQRPEKYTEWFKICLNEVVKRIL